MGSSAPEHAPRPGKPAEGRILLSAARERNTVALRVIDDGRGIDRAAILAKARREGLADATTDTLTDDLLLRVLARPGFSTAAAVSGVSGRGVGVDVAMTRVRALGGTLEVRSELGRGTTFLIRVPLTLAIVRALLAEAGGERYAVPLAYVAETVEFDRRAVTSVRDREALVVRDQVIPTVHLRDLVAGRRRGAPAARGPTVILEVGRAAHRAGGRRAGGTAGHRGRAVRCAHGACRRSWAGRRFSPTARRRSFWTPRRSCRRRAWKTCVT